MSQQEKFDPGQICFGLDRQTDEESLALFLRGVAQPELLSQLIPRLSDEEVRATVDFLTGIMHNHFSESEYHRFFLGRTE
ncbi:MAG: hypothetical protein ABFR97_06365 [Thermodesulfobacteriota bacterium]